jgi:hypothetical protein
LACQFQEVCFSVCLTLAITWPQEVLNEEENLAVAAQVHGDVREHRAKVVNHP